MAETLKKPVDIAALSSENASPAPLQDEKKPWHRQEGESVLWFNRFERYRKLGAKRSLQAAVVQEHEQVKALKSTKEGQSEKRTEGKARTKRGQAAQIAPVAPLPVQVPGSWKAASVTWHWVERARAWDTWKIDRIVQKHLDELQGDTLAFNFTRIRTLDSMVNSLADIFNRNGSQMSIQEVNALTAQMQSLLRDIRKEMEGFDEAVARTILTYNVSKLYNNLDKELAKRDKAK